MKTEQREHDAIRMGDFIKHSKGWFMVVRLLSRAPVCTTFHAVFADGSQCSIIVYAVADAAPRGEVPASFGKSALALRASKLRADADTLTKQSATLDRMAQRLR